LIGGWMG